MQEANMLTSWWTRGPFTQLNDSNTHNYNSYYTINNYYYIIN